MATLFRVASTAAVALLLLHLCSGESYMVDTCMCQLDKHLLLVRQKLAVKEEAPPTPTPPPPPTTTNPPTTTDSTTAGTETTESATTESATTESATTESPTTSDDSQTAKRKKRATEEEKKEEEEKELSVDERDPARHHRASAVFGPKGRAAWGSEAALVNEVGVLYDIYYRPQLCACTNGSSAQLSFCLKNKPYNSSYENPMSDISKLLTAQLLPWLSKSYLFIMKELFLRALPIGYTELNKHIQVHYEIILRKRVYKPEYYVKTGFETTEVRNGEFKINGNIYKTDIEDSNCYSIKDTTLPTPRVPSIMDSLRWIFLIAALAVFVLLILLLCIGKRDKFYVRFW